MSEVNPASATAGSPVKPATVGKAASTADYDAFLGLLVAQLKNQDPTNPSDPAQFLSQLASFSSVEQQMHTNESLAALISLTQAGQAAGLIGKTIATQDGGISGIVSSVTITSGNLVANLDNGAKVPLANGYVLGS